MFLVLLTLTRLDSLPLIFDVDDKLLVFIGWPLDSFIKVKSSGLRSKFKPAIVDFIIDLLNIIILALYTLTFLPLIKYIRY